MSTIWTLWLLFFILSFAILEAHALSHNKTTLSRYVWIASKRFPLLPFIIGLIVGVLACHFFWGGIVCFEGLSK